MKKTTFLILFLGALIFEGQAQYWNLSGNSTTSTSNFLGTTDCQPLIFKTNNTERMRLLNDKSFLGIGLSMPQATLHLHHQIGPNSCEPFVSVSSVRRLLQITTPETGNNGNNGFSISFKGTKEVILQQQEQANFSINGPGGGLTIAPNSNVGIGTASPLHKLHIEDGNLLLSKTSTNPSVSIFFGEATANLPDQWEISFTNTGSSLDGLNFSKRLSYFIPDTSNRGGDRLITSVLFLGSNDNVAIGHQNPQAKLDVSGSFKTQSANITGALTAKSATINGAFTANSAKITGALTAKSADIAETVSAKIAHISGTFTAADLLFAWGRLVSIKGDTHISGETHISGNVKIGEGLFSNLSLTGNAFIGGKVKTTEVEVSLDVWPDFVFENNYPLMSLPETEQFIKANKHLPNVPSAAEVEANGINLGEMNAILIQKVEELTLYILDLQKQINEIKTK
ncbi:MAG: hypothetical protein FWC10_07870 [Lentimicrobiaceae bacterium]|nr:hypothetical protein [Lentimicrobiaceae bacterium]